MKPILINISGKSGVGKTTIASLLTQIIGTDKCILLSTDDLHKYERNNPIWEKTTHFNPQANNIELGDFHINQLLKHKSIYRSLYNHNSGKFDPPKLITPKPFIINEGLHAFYSNKMKQLSDFKIYVDTDEELTKLWKIKRDTKYRGKSKSEVLKSIRLRKKDEPYIEQQKKYADLILKFNLEDNNINLVANNITKSLRYKNLVNKLIEYFNDIKTLVLLSNEYGNNPSYIQGPAGNISVKHLNNMLIKSSGVCLKDIDYFYGWSNINIDYLSEYFSFSKDLDDTKYFNILKESVQNHSIPSMESGMHSILKKYVIHTHPNELMHILCHKNCKKILKNLYKDIDYCFVPLMMPGLDLYEFISTQSKTYNVYFLQNHGLIVNSDNYDDLKIHHIICQKALDHWAPTNLINTQGYITPDEYIFRDKTDTWYSDMKEHYTTIKKHSECNVLSNSFLSVLDNLEFEKHRKSI